MSATRPARGEDSATRSALLDATLQLMAEEGYAAVSTRKVAAKAGANPALVYYYFRTMDELFLAVFRRGAEANLRRLRHVAEADHPLRALWEVSSDAGDTTLTMEFIALANHRPAIRTELAAYFTRFRALQEDIARRALDTHPAERDRLSPAALTVMVSALARILAMDEALGLTTGHDDIRGLIEDYLRRFEETDTESSGGAAPG